MDTIRTLNPANGELIAELAVDGQQQVDAAVERAVDGQRSWGRMTGTERGRILRRAADILRSRNAELAQLETRDTGKPIQETEELIRVLPVLRVETVLKVTRTIVQTAPVAGDVW